MIKTSPPLAKLLAASFTVNCVTRAITGARLTEKAIPKILTRLLAFACLCLSLGSHSAYAAYIAGDSTNINQTAQSYNATLALPSTPFTNVTLDITAKGDYGTSSTENIRFFVDGNLLADWTYSTTGISTTNNYNNYDYTLIGSISISQSQWDNLASDGVLNISWINGSGVNPYPSQGGADSVIYAFNGDVSQVPVPAAVWLFSSALIGLAAFKRKK